MHLFWVNKIGNTVALKVKSKGEAVNELSLHTMESIGPKTQKSLTMCSLIAPSQAVLARFIGDDQI